jgi:hypothetical protein
VVRDLLDATAAESGVKHAEQLMFINMMLEIGGTDETGNKILKFIHDSALLNRGSGVDWIAEHLPKRYTTIKKNVSAKLKVLNHNTDARCGE